MLCVILWVFLMKPSLFYMDSFVSKILKIKVAKLDLPEIKNIYSFKKTYKKELIENEFKIVVGNTSFYGENVKFFEDEEYKLISSKSLYCLKANRNFVERDIENNEFQILTDKNFSLDFSYKDVLEFIEIIGGTSHYCKNLKLWGHAYKNIYKEWLKNTFSGYSDKIFVAVKKNERNVIGILSLKKKQHGIFIDLLGIHPNYRGLGLASILLGKAIGWVRNQRERLYVYTQGENIIANRFYQKSGFIIQDFKLVYHKIFT